MIFAFRSLQKIIIFPILIGALFLSQYYFDIETGKRPETGPIIIPAKAIKIADLGLDSAVSSLMWIYAIQELNDFPDKFPEIVKTINNLDPKFSYPYAFSALLLPDIGFIDQGIQIAEEGIKNADPDWRIPYYLATAYHVSLKDRAKAAYYFDLAANTPGATEVPKTVAARYGTSSNYRDQTKAIWESIYTSSTDQIVKENAKAHLEQIAIIELLEKAVSIYKGRFGTPKNINDLVNSKILTAIPPSPFGVEFYLDEKGQVLIR